MAYAAFVCDRLSELRVSAERNQTQRRIDDDESTKKTNEPETQTHYTRLVRCFACLALGRFALG